MTEETELGAAVLLGVLTHLAIQPLELEKYGWWTCGVYALANGTVLCDYIILRDMSALTGIFRTFMVASGFLAGLVTSMVIYRGFFHRLRRFPGPFLASLSKFYTVTMAVKTIQQHINYSKLHAQYGDFVRVGPRELSINSLAALDTLFGPTAQSERAKWYDANATDPDYASLLEIRDKTLHKRRKKIWERGLSFRALASYEPRVVDKANMLISHIASHLGQSVDMAQRSMFYGFDTMGDLAFSKDFGMLKSGIEHPAIDALHTNLIFVGAVMQVPWLVPMLAAIPGAAESYKKFQEWCGGELREKRKGFHREKSMMGDQDPRDIVSWFLKAADEGDPAAPHTEVAWQEEARLMIIAGSDTASVTLTNALYFLTKYPDCYRKLQRLIDATPRDATGEASYEAVKEVAYLDFVIQETLRLKPGVPSGSRRVTPPGGIVIDGVHVPGDVLVGVPTHLVQRDPRYWDEPLRFAPERWEGLAAEKTAFNAFNRGLQSCPGRNLAFMELRMVLSRVATHFDMAFAPGFDVEAWDQNAQDRFVLHVFPLPIIFKARGERL